MVTVLETLESLAQMILDEGFVRSVRASNDELGVVHLELIVDGSVGRDDVARVVDDKGMVAHACKLSVEREKPVGNMKLIQIAVGQHMPCGLKRTVTRVSKEPDAYFAPCQP